jgi:MFS family permease
MSETTGRALHALRLRDFRLIALGNTMSQMGTWVQYVALGWVARSLTANPFLISLVFAAQWLPFLLLSPFTGVVADRLDRRSIILWGNLAMIVPAVVLGSLISFDAIRLCHAGRECVHSPARAAIRSALGGGPQRRIVELDARDRAHDRWRRHSSVGLGVGLLPECHQLHRGCDRLCCGTHQAEAQ